MKTLVGSQTRMMIISSTGSIIDKLSRVIL